MANLSVDQTLSRAKSHAKKGEFDKAQKLYQSVLQALPKNGRAQKGLDTLKSFRKPSGVQLPAQEAIDHLLEMYKRGDLCSTVERARALTQQFPEAYVVWNVLGAALQQLGQDKEALCAFKQTTKLNPNFADGFNNFGFLLQSQGKLGQAINAYVKAISIKSTHADAFNNMGTAFYEQSKYNRAIQAFDKALCIRPKYSQAYYNKGCALRELGKLAEAIKSYYKALMIKPDYTKALHDMGNALKGVTFDQPIFGLQKILCLLIDQKNFVRPKDIAGAAISLLKLEPNLQKHLSKPEMIRDKHSLQVTVSELSCLPLLLKLMHVCPLADLGLESLLREIRTGILLNLSSFVGNSDVLEFQSALASQCFINEYVYGKSEDEEQLITTLENSVQTYIEKGEKPSPQAILCLASYKALYEYEFSKFLTDPGDFYQVFIQQVSEPKIENQLKNNIPKLKGINDNISMKVQAQYESNPYPRWVNLGLPLRPHPISKILDYSKIKLFDVSISKVTTPTILIAGCGTGQHSIGTAASFENSKVMAVDLSLSSLAYAQRKSVEFGITNIKYMQADLLHLNKLDIQFDIIESAGVLHHMENPLKGWRVLVGCLKAGGLMKIGLYSELARKHITEVRREVYQTGTCQSDVEMKSFRDLVINSDLEHHNNVKLSPDFYSLSTFRDLVFHVQEHRFTIPKLKKCLVELGLEFCGFEDKRIVQNFSDSNIKKDDLYDLDKWQKFEEANPTIFAGMYEFWCQKIS